MATCLYLNLAHKRDDPYLAKLLTIKLASFSVQMCLFIVLVLPWSSCSSPFRVDMFSSHDKSTDSNVLCKATFKKTQNNRDLGKNTRQQRGPKRGNSAWRSGHLWNRTLKGSHSRVDFVGLLPNRDSLYLGMFSRKGIQIQRLYAWTPANRLIFSASIQGIYLTS